MVYAHVRAAYPGMPVNEQSCHPFSFRKYMWMHNGNIGGFFKVIYLRFKHNLIKC